jgi:hypothetical protein
MATVFAHRACKNREPIRGRLGRRPDGGKN